MTPTTGQQGFSLIEVLIGILIFSVGIIALVAAQAAAKQYAADTEWNAEAMHHASALVARLRVADQATVAADYSSPSGARYVEWKDQVATGTRALPGASTYPPTVTFDRKSVTVEMRWAAGAAQATPRKLVLVTELD